LQKNYAKTPGVWLVFYRKDSGEPGIAYAEAVEEALCFGWIDGTKNPHDEKSSKQLFTPRRPKSNWSKPNKLRVKEMIDAGLMTPAGMEKIEAAKKDGSWDILNDVDDMIIPPDLKKALAANKIAKKHFDAFSNTNKKYVLYWLVRIKGAEKRAQIIKEVVESAAENLLHPKYRPVKKPAKK
jgi:uncharacterized protein YdeI (YjbR/CyaY-like superfamily)